MSAWYRTGTINVPNGSTTLTGSGTAFVANVSAGMMVVANNQIIGEVAAVVSDTQITLAVAYAGTALTGASYAIVNLGAVRNSLITAVQDLTALIEAAQDGALSGRFGDGTLAEPGMAFAGDIDTGFYRPGANRIAATKILEAPTFGGAGVQSSPVDATAGRLLKVGAAGVALGADVYRRANILGTVGQSGGVPTGAVIERGSNANGEYVRFADGTQICTRQITLSAPNVADGAGFSGATSTNWTYPAGFAPGITPAIGGACTNVGKVWVSSFVASNTAASLIAARFTPVATAPVTNVFAIGRWF